jgi:copper(I)-binding protein
VAALITAGALALAACGPDPAATGAELTVSGAYMPQPVSADLAAGFLTVTNKGGTKDELTSVSSDVAGSVTLHEVTGGAMSEVDRLTVPAHGRLVLESGGRHLMFEKLKRRPRQGQQVPVELHFAHSGTVKVEMPVEPATYRPATGY